MTHLYAELNDEAAQAMTAMQDAAHEARDAHARAELLRHMHATAAKPGADASFVTREWLDAWGLAVWPGLAAEARRFTDAILRYAAAPGDAADRAVRDALASLDAAFAAQGTTLADQMAHRSRCAHKWWALVAPEPPGQPFWTRGCPNDCL